MGDLFLYIIGAAVLINLIWFVVRPALRKTRPSLPDATSSTPASAPASTSARLDDRAFIAEIDALVRTEQKITAVKRYREHTGVGLKAAKDAIEAWVPGSAALPAPVAPTASVALPASVTAEIDRLITADRKIEAIKVYREHTGLGLKESKKAIDGWAPGDNVESA